MIDRAKIFAGDLNEQALEPQPHRTVTLLDATLCDGERPSEARLEAVDRREIAAALDAAGIDRIAVEPSAVADLAEVELNAELWVHAYGTSSTPLPSAGHVLVETPVSDAALEQAALSREAIVEHVRGTVSRAADDGMHVALLATDGTRADREILRRVSEAALDAGASEIVVADTAGIATPEGAAYLVGELLDHLGGGVAVAWRGRNDFGLATACAVAAVQAGATAIHGTIGGIGARAGNADLLECALALEALYGIPTRLDLTQAHTVAGLVESRTGCTSAEWKPVTGPGVSRPGPYAPEIVGAPPP